VIRIHDTLEFSDLEFALHVRPLAEVASVEVFQDGFGLDPVYGGGLGARKGLKKIGQKLKKIVKKHLKRLKKGFLKAAPILGIVALALNFIVPGLGVLVGLAINLAAGAIQMADAKKAAQKAKKVEKKAETADAAEEAVEQQAADADADQASVDAYTKGESYFVSKYGMTREKFMALTPKGRYDFLMGTTYDVNVSKFASKGVSREAFITMPIDSQTALLAQINAAAGIMTEEDAINAMLGGSTPVSLIAIGVGAVAIILIVYLLTRK
jgi:hypothetical protein